MCPAGFEGGLKEQRIFRDDWGSKNDLLDSSILA